LKFLRKNFLMKKPLIIVSFFSAEQEKDEGISGDIWSNNNGQKAENKNWVFSKNTKFEQTKGEGGGNPSNYSSKNFQKYTRKDNYRLTVATGANATNLFSGGEGKNNFDRRSPSFNADNNFEQCVDVVLHSSSFQSFFFKFFLILKWGVFGVDLALCR